MNKILASLNIGKRIILGFSLLILLFLVVMITVEVAGIPGAPVKGKFAATRDKNLDDLELASGLLGERLTSWFAERRIDVDGLTVSPMLRRAVENRKSRQKPEITDELNAFLKSHPHIDAVALYDPAGTSVSAVGGTVEKNGSLTGIAITPEQVSRFGIPGYQEMIEIIFAHDNKPHLRIVRQVLSTDPSQRVVALLVAEFDLEKALRPLIWSVRNSIISHDWECIIASAVGDSISQFRVGKDGVKPLSAPLSKVSKSVPITLALSGINGPYEGLDQFGNNVLAFHRQIHVDRSTSLGLVLKVESGLVYKQTRDDLIRQIVLWLALFGSGFILCIFLARQIVSPIKALAVVARKIEDGDLTARSSDNDQSEVGQLAKIFNGMVAKIENSHQELEELVQNRTHDLQNLSDRQNALLSAVPDIILEVDVNRVFTWANNAGLEFFGDDVIGKEAAWYFAGEQEIYQKTKPLFEGTSDVVYVESRQKRKDGEVRLLAWWCKALVNGQGAVTGILSTARDITESKQAEAMLRDSEEKYRVLVKHLSSGVVVHAADTTIIFSNPMASTLLGLSKDQLRGKEAMDPAWCFIHENGATLSLEEYPVNKVLSSGKPVSNQVLGIKRPDLPEPVWVQCNSYPVTAANGALLQVVVTFTDITERKRDKEVIEKRLIALMQPLEYGVVAFDEMFNIPDVQRLQDEFARATGVASIITCPDGTPLTAPSNFTRLCNDIIRKTEKGCASCYKSDAALGRYNPDGPNIQPCLSGGLWDAGAGISVGGHHIANWLIGQVRDETQTEEKMAAYAHEIGVDEALFLEAFREVPCMSRRRFEQVAQALFTLANQLSTSAYQNIQQARFINERKVAEESLRTSEELHRSLSNELQTILNTSPAGICLLKNRKVQRANAAFDRMFGYEAGTTVNLDTATFYPREELYESTGQEAYRLLLEGGTYKHDVLMRKKSGALFWCNISGHAVKPGNLNEGSIWILQDISDRKQSEEQLASLTKRLQLATSSAHLGVWDWNITENSMVWDDRMFELYGITRETFPNSIDAWLSGLHPQDKEAAIAECQAALKGEKEFDTEFRVLHPDGAVKHIRAKGLVVRGANGNAERMIGINYDVSDTKHAEEEKHKLEAQLQQAQKMESVGRLAGGVAHDFNNMLSVIMGHAELALMHLDPGNTVCNDLREISTTAKRSADLTRQLLVFARKQTVSPKIIDLNDTIATMFKMLQRLIGESIQLVWQPSPDRRQVKMDPSQIDQILANLCVNARDAIADIGRITIATTNCAIDADYCATNPDATPGNYVRLTVSDNGKGMDRDTLAHVFEPFYTTKEMGKGTGLGLATVYGAVKQNNGFINIYSEPGKGTTFSIHLPQYTGEAIRDQAEVASQAVPRGQETILLVEDEAAILNVTAIMLEKQGYFVLRANSPGRAMELAREHHGAIDLVMTDVIMPAMNGRDLVCSLVSLHPGMKWLFMSGYTADVIAHHGVLDDGAQFIQKPFSLPDMAAKVREVLDGN